MVFARVTRVVTRAHDLSLWLPQPAGGTVYIGDNMAVAPENCIAEYDYFYGFCKQVGGRQTFHFASPQAAQLDFLHDATGEWIPYICLDPPNPGTLICGVASCSVKGVSLTKWWVCPVAFFELWKLVMNPPTKPVWEKLVTLGPLAFVCQAIAAKMLGVQLPLVIRRKLPHFYRDGQVKSFMDVFDPRPGATGLKKLCPRG